MRPLSLTLSLLCLAAGCAGPQGQLTQCQSDKEQLLTTIREQRDEVESLRSRSAALELRLAESEKALARLDPSRSMPADSRLTTSSQPGQPLAWRPHRVATEEAKTASDESPLAQLAAREERLQFDRQTKTARVNLDIPFQGDTPALSAEGRQALDELARMLRSGVAADTRIVVTGLAPEGRHGRTVGGRTATGGKMSPRQLALARAQSVADYLDRRGVAGDRLAVASVASSDSPAVDGGVEIVLADPQTAVVALPGPESAESPAVRR